MRTPVTSARTRETLAHLRDESVRRLVASEKAVEREFHTARLLVSLAAGLVLVGFLLVAQWRGNATLESSLERLSDQNLAIIIQEITAENSSLRSEIMRLETRIFAAQGETKDRGEVLNEAAKELRAIRLISGLDAASGPGVRIIIVDPQRVLLPQDFVSLVQELRAGGAEAIAVNGVRVGAMSGFSGVDGTIELDGEVLTRDFEVGAVGDPASLEQAIALPGGLKSTLSTFPGVRVDILRLDEVTVSQVAGVAFEFGEPYEE
jgi:uncharacterized protein YlxW (UPF0749 family)